MTLRAVGTSQAGQAILLDHFSPHFDKGSSDAQIAMPNACDRPHCAIQLQMRKKFNQATSHCELPDISEKPIIISFPKHDFS